uniref:Uncharacterized protein n=1 Tax=Phlebotomus papatasi TaxID=29031 RepID=A0A1B0DKX6_PHLPP
RCDVHEITVTVDNVEYIVNLEDTAGQEGYERLRGLLYESADAFILCYAIPERDSFNSIKLKWIKELREKKPNAPILLVGTKSDARIRSSVSTQEGEALGKSIRANSFIECSAKTQENVNEVFYEVVRAAVDGIIQIESESNRKISCCCGISMVFKPRF